LTHDLYGRPPRAPAPEEVPVTRRSLLRLRLTPLARRETDHAGPAAAVREAWARCEHRPLLRAIEPVAEVVAELAEVGPGTRVLDVGTADGNLALACLERGAEVDACDLAPVMVERARARLGDRARLAVADARQLPYAEASFDAVLSTFGASLAPDAERAAAELARVARPGAVVCLCAWVPRGLPGGLQEHVERLAPLPAGVPSPAEWGRQAIARERLEPLLDRLELRTRTVPLSFDSIEAAFDAIAGPAPLDEEGREQLRPTFDRLLRSCNNVSVGVEISARYLIAIGRRPAVSR
jgi:SAM-dependent methyltransferase